MLRVLTGLARGLPVLTVLALWPAALRVMLGQPLTVSVEPLWALGLAIGLGAVWADAWAEGAAPATRGPYSRVRNPLALAGLLLGIGWEWSLESPAVAAATLVGSLLWQVTAGARRESRLEERFEEAQRRYRAAVPLWLPAWRAYPPPRRIPGDGRTRLYFDGRCPICRAQAERLERWCGPAVERGELRLLDFRVARPAELPLEECEAAMQVVDAGGRVRAGLDGIVAALCRHSGQRWWAWLYRLPGGGWLADPVYDWIARHRPQDCSAATCAPADTG